jgi:hypothetical protein
VDAPTTLSDGLSHHGHICTGLPFSHSILGRERDARCAKIQRLEETEQMEIFIKKEILKSLDFAIVFGCCG